MTTIVYREGIIAYDGRVISGDNVIINDNQDKMVVEGDLHFLCAVQGLICLILSDPLSKKEHRDLILM